MARDLASLADTLGEIVGPRHVRTALPERVTYARDGLPTHRHVPGVVVLPGSRDEVVAVVRLLAALGVPFVPRGAGTGLSGGALADDDAVLMVLTRLNRILAIDPKNRLAVVEPGVVNVRLSAAAAPHGLYYAPDPSSQTACTIGGNVAENAGGPHCLKYGVTAQHVLALEVVLADGRIVELGSPGGEPWGPDVVGLFVGSEGNFGIATRRPCCSSSSTGIPTRRWPPTARRFRSCSPPTARHRSASPVTRPSGTACGRGGRRRSARWAACRATSSSRMPSSRAPPSPMCSKRSGGSRRRTSSR